MDQNAFRAVLSITITIVAFYCYHYLSSSGVFSKWMRVILPKKLPSTMVEFIAAKSAGILFLGLIPMVIFIFILSVSRHDLGVTFSSTGRYWYIPAFLPVLFILFSFLASGKPRNREFYPQMRLPDWPPGSILISLSGWALYLLSYEFLFRGILWFLCFYAFGFWPALVINIALYSALHMPKGLGETLGAIPMGALLCVITWLTGSIFTAFLVHISMAGSMEIFSIYHNPDMHFILKKK